ncbi:hypothetical protein [Pseudomonas putida]|uniref:hypothetical protein n=1 Tax=Pseudomonas putida TaxID=303 RepID=UPI002364A29C|nr:hypothetical protein [Pseudomonas putida]MDD2005083.1 hypothetical protein [Pseudomonas putida]
MNIPGRNLLSLTVYHLRHVVRLMIGEPKGIWITCHEDGTATVGGNGAVPGSYLIVSFPDGSIASTTVTASGAWQVVSGVLDSCPLAGDLEIVTGDPASVGVIDSIEITPDGSYLISGHGGRAGDVMTVTIDGEEFTLNLTGENTWHFTVTPAVTPPDIGPGDGEVDSDYVPPYVISITPVGDGTYIIIGGGGKIGDTLNVIANGVSYPVIVHSDNGWTATVGVKDTDPSAPPDVEVEDRYVAPYIISVVNNGGGTYTITGGGGRAGDRITINIDDKSFEATIETDNHWTVIIEYVRHIDLDDVVVIVSPKELEGFVSAGDAVYADVDDMAMVECTDDGKYISWESFVRSLKGFVDIVTTPIAKFSNGYDRGYPKKTIKVGSTYISVYDYKYLIYTSSDIENGTERAVEKRYMTSKNCNAHKTNHTAYYWRKDGELDRLCRYDGVDSDIVVDISDRNLFGDNNLPMIVSLGSKDWVVNNTFGLSVFIDPVTMETSPGPAYDFSMACDGEAGSCAFNSSSAFFQGTSNSALEFRSDGTIVEIERADFNSLVATDQYLFRLGGDTLSRVDLQTYEMSTNKEVPFALGLRGAYGVDRTIISYSSDSETGGSQMCLSSDSGDTWKTFFLKPGQDRHIYSDVEGDELILTIAFADIDNLEVYKLVEG